jgi:hypothetical protein
VGASQRLGLARRRNVGYKSRRYTCPFHCSVGFTDEFRFFCWVHVSRFSTDIQVVTLQVFCDQHMEEKQADDLAERPVSIGWRSSVYRRLMMLLLVHASFLLFKWGSVMHSATSPFRLVGCL